MSYQIVFFGSGPVAAKSLELLLDSFAVEAVVTKPSTLKEMQRVAKNVPVHTVANRAELDELMGSKPFASRLAILIDFGIIVSRQVIDYFPLGIINSHFSLLPLLRGADPITFAILNGDEKTGVSLMLLDEQMDTGKLIGQKSLKIEPPDTTPTLTDKLISLSAELLKEYVPKYVSGEVTPRSQPHPERATYSRKLTKEDGRLDWTKTSAELAREIRAFAGWPKSRTTLGTVEVTIIEAIPLEMDKAAPGTLHIEKKELAVATTDGWLEILTLQPDGKREMPVEAFLAGYSKLLS